MKIHEKEVHKCDEWLCNFKTADLNVLNAHKESQHTLKHCRNEKCGYKTKRMTILRRHEKTCRAGVVVLECESISEEETAAVFAKLKSCSIRLAIFS